MIYHMNIKITIRDAAFPTFLGFPTILEFQFGIEIVVHN